MGALQALVQASAIVVACVDVLHHGRGAGSASGGSGDACDHDATHDMEIQIVAVGDLRGREFEACLSRVEV